MPPIIFLSDLTLFFPDFPGQAAAGPVQPHRDGRLGASDDGRNVAVRHLLPHGQAEDFLIGIPQAGQGGEDDPAVLRRDHLGFHVGGARGLAAEPGGEIVATAVPPPLVGQHPPGHPVEPG